MLKRNINLFFGKSYFDYRNALNKAFLITKISLKAHPRVQRRDESFADYLTALYKDENHYINFDDLELFLLNKEIYQIGRYSIPVVRGGRKTYITLKNLTYTEFQNALKTLNDPVDLRVMSRFEEIGGLSELAANYYKTITMHNSKSMEEIQENQKLFMPLVFRNPITKPKTIAELVKAVCIETMRQASYWKIDDKLIQQCTVRRRRSALDIWLHVREYDPNITIREVRNIMTDWARDKGCDTSICSTVRRRVFYRFGDPYGELYNLEMKDEYGCRFRE